MKPLTFHRQGHAFAIAVIWLSSMVTQAQTPSGSSDLPQPAGSQQERGPSGSEEPVVAPLIYAPTLDQPGIKQLGGSGNWFSENMSLFSWGPIALSSVAVLYGYSSANPEAGLPASLSSAVLQANVAYSKRLRRSLLVLQYNPRLFYTNGQWSLAAANQDAALNTLFAPTPHLTVGISEAFAFYGRLNTLNDKTFASGTTDAAIANPFLNSMTNDHQQTWVESFSLPLNYNLNERTSIRISPLFNYVHTSEPSDPTALSQGRLAFSMFDYGAQTQMSHAVAPNQTVGLFYTYQTDRQTDVQGTTSIHSFGVSGSRRLGTTLTVTGQGGASYSKGPFTGWTAVASVSVAKSFQRGSLEASYGRDSTFTGLVGSEYNNRAWASYSRQAGHRMNWNVGGGYISGVILGHNSGGKYATARIDYSISSTVAWSFSYVHLWETGTGIQLVNGTQQQLQIGLRWTPQIKPGT